MDYIPVIIGGLIIMFVMYKYKWLNDYKNYAMFLLGFALMMIILLLIFKIELRFFSFVIAFILLYQPNRWLFRWILNREPILYVRGMRISEEDEDKMTLDYFFWPVLLFESFFFGAFYFWDNIL